MNDTELDRLLDAWEAPPPRPSLRENLRLRFPRAERRRFSSPLRWALVAAVASITLAVGMGQSGRNPADNPLIGILNHMYEHVLFVMETWRAKSIVDHIRQSDPKVYVDGQLVGPLEYGPAATMRVDVPGDGTYSLTSYPVSRQDAAGRPTGWTEAGQIQGDRIEFQAGSRQVRIKCNRPITDSELPIFARRHP